ncbi:MAG: oxidoreductase [Capsulimonas sp.]|jgi:predicted dehydrogenase|nr:oxidoreductase [Capsulimonas sp.]
MSSPIKLGVIGFGERARHMVRMIQAQDPEARLTAIADPQCDALRKELLAADPAMDLPRFYQDADEMLDTEVLDGVIIGTRCSLHAQMAVKVMARDIALLLEKPVGTNLDDLMTLRAARSSRVVVSFPLRLSRLVRLARQIIDSGKIGVVEHVQSWNNVPYGNVYFQTWYRDEAETQGLFLQKATHDFDYINYLLGDMRPRVISAMTSKRVFRGEHPAGLRCMDCAEKKVCFESPYHPSRLAPIPLNQPAKEMCAFAVDTGNEDSGSALIEYESGMHVAYSQNFYARNKAARRGATLIGYHGTIEFDWYPERLKVYLHHSDQVETHEFGTEEAHGGGDAMLAANFVGVIRGTEESVSPLEKGLTSALMCLKAKESAATHRFQDVQWPAAYPERALEVETEREMEFARVV